MNKTDIALLLLAFLLGWYGRQLLSEIVRHILCRCYRSKNWLALSRYEQLTGSAVRGDGSKVFVSIGELEGEK